MNWLVRKHMKNYPIFNSTDKFWRKRRGAECPRHAFASELETIANYSRTGRYLPPAHKCYTVQFLEYFHSMQDSQGVQSDAGSMGRSWQGLETLNGATRR